MRWRVEGQVREMRNGQCGVGGGEGERGIDGWGGVGRGRAGSRAVLLQGRRGP